MVYGNVCWLIWLGEDWYNGYDDDGDGLIDEDYFYADGIDNGESYVDSNDNGEYDDGEPFYDWNYDGQYTGPNDFTDENIDVYGDAWYDGYDNDGNGLIDDTFELSTANKDEPSNWVNNLVENNIVVFNMTNFPVGTRFVKPKKEIKCPLTL